MTRRFFASAIVAAALLQGAGAALAYTETVDGDLSDDRLAPTALTLAAGSNGVLGNFGGGDLDYVALTVPAGHLLDAIVVGLGTSVSGSVSFIGVQAGPVMTVTPDSFSPEGLLGWVHFGADDYGQDVLGKIGQGPGATGFAPPLGSGTYTFWIQETASPAVYELDFQVSPVPEPSTVLTFAAGLTLLGLTVVRRRG